MGIAQRHASTLGRQILQRAGDVLAKRPQQRNRSQPATDDTDPDAEDRHADAADSVGDQAVGDREQERPGHQAHDQAMPKYQTQNKTKTQGDRHKYRDQQRPLL